MSNGDNFLQNNESGAIRAQGRKKSNFPAETSVLGGASFDYFVNGVNFKITFEDLKASLGVTGTLAQDGAVTGVPVLDQAGTDNFIRNLEFGSGVKGSVSPENGISILHNFIFNTIGAPLTDDAAATSPILKSILPGTGISLVETVNTIELNATGVTVPLDTVIINTEADFPVQDGSTITLEAATVYRLANTFSTAKRFIVENGAALVSNNSFGSTLTYTGVGNMFTMIDASFTIASIRISSPNALQTFSFVDTVGQTKVFFSTFVAVVETPKYGTFTDANIVLIQDSAILSAADGVTLAGILTTVFIDKVTVASTDAGFIGADLGTAVIENLNIQNSQGQGTTGIGISGLPNNGNIPVGAVADIVNNNFGSLTPVVGITTDDFRFFFSGNTDIADTRQLGLNSLSGNVTNTVVALSTPTLALGTWVPQSVTSHFTADAAGRITYNGERPFSGAISINATLDTVGGGSKNIAIYLAVNGSIVAETVQSASVAAASPMGLTSIWDLTFAENDFIELFVENQTNTDSIIVTDAVIRIS